MNKSERLRGIVVQGWTIMFIVFVANIVMDLVRVAVEGTQAQWAAHMGMNGIVTVLVVMSIYALMSVLISTYSARWFRFVVVGVTSLMALFVGAHQVSHLLTADKPFGLLHVLDFTHHAIAIWVIVAASLWVRQPD